MLKYQKYLNKSVKLESKMKTCCKLQICNHSRLFLYKLGYKQTACNGNYTLQKVHL